MSNLTANGLNGLVEAYAAVHDQDLREELEEEKILVEQVGIDMIENAAYVLFSRGYDVDDVISYFTEATTNTIIEDYLNFSEGNLIIESVIVSDAYIAEQFEILNERVPGLGWLASQAGRAANAVRGAVEGVKKSAETYNRAKNIQNIRNAKNAVPPGSAKVTTSANNPKPRLPGTGPKITGDVKKGFLGKAADWAKTQLRKLPGSGTVAKIAKSPVGKIAGKALPGLGAAAYGVDAANRLKKGDWGGAALSGLGAATSFAGPVAALAPLGIQMATDAAGLTGDRSRKGSTKPTTAGPPSLKAKQDYAKSKGKYYSSSDGKTYKNYNDALAARNSRRGVKPAPAPASSSSSASSTPGSSKPPASKPESKPAPTADTKLTKMQQWAKANPKLAAKVKVGQSGYDEISAIRTKPGPNERQDQTPTTGPKTTPEQDKNLARKAGEDVKAELERQKRKAQQSSSTTTLTQSYEYDAYDLVLEYLLSQGHADTLEEANYVMLEMDAETIQNIVETRRDPRGRPASGPMNVYGKSKPNTDPSFQAALTAYREKQKKKSPEEKKKELDAYIERQRNR